MKLNDLRRSGPWLTMTTFSLSPIPSAPVVGRRGAPQRHGARDPSPMYPAPMNRVGPELRRVRGGLVMGGTYWPHRMKGRGRGRWLTPSRPRPTHVRGVVHHSYYFVVTVPVHDNFFLLSCFFRVFSQAAVDISDAVSTVIDTLQLFISSFLNSRQSSKVYQSDTV